MKSRAEDLPLENHNTSRAITAVYKYPKSEEQIKK
jgi:hypothetical protein